MYSLVPKVFISCHNSGDFNLLVTDQFLTSVVDTRFIKRILRNIADDLERTLDDDEFNDGWLRRLEPTLAPLYYQTESDSASRSNRIFVDDFAKGG